MYAAVISGDIISSTSLIEEDRLHLADELENMLNQLKVSFNIFGRVIKGDYIECLIFEPEMSMQIMLAIKGYVKAIKFSNHPSYKTDRRIKLLKSYGIKVAIGLGEISFFDEQKGIIDGEAIYLSGRLINEMTSYNKERIVIKNTIFFTSENTKLNVQFEAIFGLVDVLVMKATSKQCEILYLKLLNHSEDQISGLLNIGQSGINQQSTSLGWNAIERAILFYNDTLKKSLDERI